MAEVGKRLNGTLYCAECICTSDVVSCRIVSYRFVSAFLAGCATRAGFLQAACIFCICVCAHAQLAVAATARCQAVLRCTAASAFWAIGLTEFFVAFRRVGLVEARGVWHVPEYVRMRTCRRDF